MRHYFRVSCVVCVDIRNRRKQIEDGICFYNKYISVKNKASWHTIEMCNKVFQKLPIEGFANHYYIITSLIRSGCSSKEPIVAAELQRLRFWSRSSVTMA